MQLHPKQGLASLFAIPIDWTLLMGIRLQESLDMWSGIEALHVSSQQGEGSQAVGGKNQMYVEQVKQIVVCKGDLEGVELQYIIICYMLCLFK